MHATAATKTYALSLHDALPICLTLTRIQVSNPDEPMRNAVEVSRVTMRLDGGSLLRRKVIVEEMILDGVRLNTPRDRKRTRLNSSHRCISYAGFCLKKHTTRQR